MKETYVDNWVYIGPIIICVLLCAAIAGLELTRNDKVFGGTSSMFLIISIPACIAKVHWDLKRITQYFTGINCTLLKIYWEPFAPGWLAHSLMGSYEVLYYDSQRRHHAVTCRTGLMEGVYFTNQQIISQPDGEFYFRGEWHK